MASSIDMDGAADRRRIVSGLGAVYRRRERGVLVYGSLILFLAVWEVGAVAGWINTFFFSSPHEVIRVGLDSLLDATFWRHVQVSGTEFVLGYVAGLVCGVVFGLVTGWYRRLGLFVDPWLAGLNATPRLALIPLVVLWLGLGIWSKVVIVFIGVLVPAAVNTFYGVRTVDRGHLQVARSFGASEVRLFRTVVFPSALPFSLAAARIGVGRGVSGFVVAEFYSSQEGLGYWIFQAGSRLQIGVVLWGTLVITALAMAAFRGVALAEDRLARGRGTVRDTQAVSL